MSSLEEKETIKIIIELDEYLLSKSCALQSELFKTCLENEKDCKEITIKVDSECFKYIYQWLICADENKPSEIPKPIHDLSLKTYVQEWEFKFLIELEQKKMIRKVLEIANYLDIKPLYELLCAKLASYIKHKIHLPNFEELICNI